MITINATTPGVSAQIRINLKTQITSLNNNNIQRLNTALNLELAIVAVHVYT